jgi:4'-phosphopantetheinyl transferase
MQSPKKEIMLSQARVQERSGAFRLRLIREQRAINACLAFNLGRSSPPFETEIVETLRASELEYFRRLKSGQRQTQYFLGRLVGKEAISLYLNEKNKQSMEISSGVFQQPFVRYCAFDTPALTLSHSSDFAIAIAYEPGHIMGVDVEQIDLAKTEIFKGSLTDHERSLAARALVGPGLVCNVLWTIKEALSKAIKCGMTIPLEILEVEQLERQSDGSFLSHFKHFGQYKAYSWLLPGFVLSITLPKKTELQLDTRCFGI